MSAWAEHSKKRRVRSVISLTNGYSSRHGLWADNHPEPPKADVRQWPQSTHTTRAELPLNGIAALQGLGEAIQRVGHSARSAGCGRAPPLEPLPIPACRGLG